MAENLEKLLNDTADDQKTRVVMAVRNLQKALEVFERHFANNEDYDWQKVENSILELDDSYITFIAFNTLQCMWDEYK